MSRHFIDQPFRVKDEYLWVFGTDTVKVWKRVFCFDGRNFVARDSRCLQ